jgi:shikimate kinase
MAIGPKNYPEVDETASKRRDTIVLVGLMGAGKSCVGRRLAESLGLPFVDSDEEIEKAAGFGVTDIFDVYGEPAFRDCERSVIARLLNGGPSIIATGGGAFMDPETRETIKATSTSIWLRADPEVLYQRTKRSRTRPLLTTEDPRAKLIALAELRYPVYAEADITVDTGNERLDATVQKVADIIAQNTNSGA